MKNIFLIKHFCWVRCKINQRVPYPKHNLKLCLEPEKLQQSNRLLFHKNNYSGEFIDTNYYKQSKQNDDFELYVTKDRFYKAYGTLPTKTPTDFEQYVTTA